MVLILAKVAGRQRVQDRETSQDGGGPREDLSLVPLPLTACAFLVPAVGMCHRQSQAVFGERNVTFLSFIFLPEYLQEKTQHNTYQIRLDNRRHVVVALQIRNNNNAQRVYCGHLTSNSNSNKNALEHTWILRSTAR